MIFWGSGSGKLIRILRIRIHVHNALRSWPSPHSRCPPPAGSAWMPPRGCTARRAWIASQIHHTCGDSNEIIFALLLISWFIDCNDFGLLKTGNCMDDEDSLNIPSRNFFCAIHDFMETLPLIAGHSATAHGRHASSRHWRYPTWWGKIVTTIKR